MSTLDNRNNAEIVFYSKSFTRNIKGLYGILNGIEKYRNRIIWVTESKLDFTKFAPSGLASAFFSLEHGHQHTWSMLENARLVIIDDVCPPSSEFLWLTRRSTVLQLWHGVPYKDIGKKSLLRHTVFGAYKNFSQFLQSSSKMLVPTQSDLKVYQEIFGEAELFVLPEPKLATLDQKFLTFKARFAGVDSAKLNLVTNKIDSGEEVIIWAPTFREVEGTWTEDVVSMVAGVAIKYNITILVKPHPHDFFLKQFHFGQESSVIQIDEWEDVYEYIKLSNGLVSDFSSLLLELKRIAYPVSRWMPDLEEYLDRHGHLDTADEMNSIHVNQTFDDAIQQILSEKTGFVAPSGANIAIQWVNKIEEILNEG